MHRIVFFDFMVTTNASFSLGIWILIGREIIRILNAYM
jgi:hypothetical protein